MAGEGLTGGPALQLPGAVVAAANEEAVTDALREVYDPELGLNIVDLGLVYGAEFEGDRVRVTMTLTSLGCPAGPQLVREVEEAVGAIPGVDGAEVELVWSPAWNPSMMSEDARMELGFL